MVTQKTRKPIVDLSASASYGGAVANPTASGNANLVKPLSGLAGQGVEPDRVTPKGNKFTSRPNARQRADIAAFDQSQGFSATKAPLQSPSAVGADGYIRPDAYAETGTFGSKAVSPAMQINHVDNSPTSSGLAVKAIGSTTALNAAGASVAAPPVVNAPAAIPAVPPSLPPALARPVGVAPSEQVYQRPASAAVVPSAQAIPNPTPAPGSTPAPGPFTTSAPAPTPASTPPVPINPTPTPGRSLASGVSNSQAAGFEQPTAEKPLPTTPTSPSLDVNDYDKKKTMFAGFR